VSTTTEKSKLSWGFISLAGGLLVAVLGIGGAVFRGGEVISEHAVKIEQHAKDIEALQEADRRMAAEASAQRNRVDDQAEKLNHEMSAIREDLREIKTILRSNTLRGQ
jgi:uncharacterized protein HemX